MTASSATLRELAASTTGPRVLRRLAMAAGLTVGAFVAGAALLALAGWFIAASAVAGLAVTTTFSFLYPSAAIRALALARTVGRYGERISTHSVTLKLVGRLRVTLFERALALPRDRVAGLRSSDLLGRITADTDASRRSLPPQPSLRPGPSSRCSRPPWGSSCPQGCSSRVFSWSFSPIGGRSPRRWRSSPRGPAHGARLWRSSTGFRRSAHSEPNRWRGQR